MQVVEILIRSNKYKLSCESDKKEHLLSLVNNFKKLVDSVFQKNGCKGSDSLNFLIAGLKLEDEVLELKKQLDLINSKLEEHINQKEMEYREILSRVNKIITHLESEGKQI